MHCTKNFRIWSFCAPYIPAFGLNTERYSLSLSIQSECGKIWTRQTPNTNTFQAVIETVTKDMPASSPLAKKPLYKIIFFFFQLFRIRIISPFIILSYQKRCTCCFLNISQNLLFKFFFSLAGNNPRRLRCRIIFKQQNFRLRVSQRKKCPYSEFFWFSFFLIQTEYGEILRISPYSVQMRKNSGQNNSEYGHFLSSVLLNLCLTILPKSARYCL